MEPTIIPSKQYHILIADDEASLRTVLAASLQKEGFLVQAAKDGAEALTLLKRNQQLESEDPFDVVISDIRMPQVDGISLLSQINKLYPDLPVIMLTAHGTVDIAVQALKQGAFDFLTKPYEREEVLMVVKKALRQRAKNASTVYVTPDKSLSLLIGNSSQMQYVLEIIERVADTPSTVLITGESGTGKELVAQALHKRSRRKDKSFIRINCAAIPETLIESELFGYEKGAFTGAVTSKPGRFELANGGTLFLDEIGELPVEIQVKLLRVLQESTFERVGGIKTIRMDTRLIAATNRNLVQAISEGKFREDLFYRLNVVPIILPPLRERLDDIPALVEHFIQKYNLRLGKNVKHLTQDALEVLKSYPWPGNIRELENILERTILFADGDVIGAKDIPPEIAAKACPSKTAIGASPAVQLSEDTSMKDIIRMATGEIERGLIQKALDETDGNVTQAAKRLKISRKSLQLKMKELGLRNDLDTSQANL